MTRPYLCRLLTSLQQRTRPIIFVAHSLGGIVLKEVRTMHRLIPWNFDGDADAHTGPI